MAAAKSQWSSYRYAGYNGSQIDEAMQSACCTAHPHGRIETVLADKIRKLSFFQKWLSASEAAMVLVGMSEMKTHVQRSSVLEESLRRKREKAPSAVPSPKAVAATLPHYVRTTQFLGRGSAFYLSPESEVRRVRSCRRAFSLTHQGAGCTRVHCFFLNIWVDITANWASLVSLSSHCYYNSCSVHVILSLAILFYYIFGVIFPGCVYIWWKNSTGSYETLE